MKGLKTAVLAAALVLAAGGASAQSTLRFGLAEDPDLLDPTLARTFVGRIVFSALCDKLMDISPDLKIVPRLATEWSWSPDNKALTMKLRQGVVFHDDEPFNAAAVKFNIERHLNMPGSNRKGEISAVSSVDVVDDHTVRLNLSSPFAPLIAQLTDRAGMMVSPKAAQAAGDKFANTPVCSGPYKFVERIAQDRIVLEKFAKHWEKDNVHFDRIVYLPVVDSTVRLANLQSGQLDFIERVLPTDLGTVQKDNRLKTASIVELGYQSIWFNVAHGDKAKGPTSNAKIREAFELAIDRDAINQVVYEGAFLPGNQWVSPTSPWYAQNQKPPTRDVAKAKKLLQEAGVTNPSITVMVANSPDSLQVVQVLQSMVGEAGIDLKLQATEFATALNVADKGDFEMFYVAWSGRTDPDGNLYNFIGCKGPLNYGRYCNEEVEKLLTESRTTSDTAARKAAYDKIAEHVMRDRPLLYLFHRKWLYAHSAKLSGFSPYPDGLVRPQGLKLN